MTKPAGISSAVTDGVMKNRGPDDLADVVGDNGADDLDMSAAYRRCAELVERMEATLDVNSLTFRGIKAWPRIRTLLLFSYARPYAEEPAKHFTAGASISHLTKTDPGLMQAANVASAQLHAIGKAHYHHALAFLGSAPRRANVNGQSVDLLFDPLIDIAPAKVPFLKFAKGSGPQADISERHATVAFDWDPILNWITQLDPAFDLFAGSGSASRSIVNFNIVRDFLPADMASVMTESALVKDLGLIWRLSIVFRVLLERLQPPFVFISGLRRVNTAMILAARQLGIPTVDIQHGAAAFSPKNIKWHSWKKIPKEGYELLPDYFWVWGELAAKNVNRHANGRNSLHRGIAGGHPTLMLKSAPDLSVEFRERAGNAKKVILVTLGYLLHDGLPANLLNAMGLAPKDWLWLIRLHPVDAANPKAITSFRAKLKAGGVKNFEIDESSAVLLREVLEVTDWHVTPYSSSAVEASTFGVPTIYVDGLATTMFDHLLARPGFYYHAKPSAIIRRLKSAPRAPECLATNDTAHAKALITALGARNSLV